MAKTRIDPKLLDELLTGQNPQKVFTSNGQLGDLKQALPGAWRSGSSTPLPAVSNAPAQRTARCGVTSIRSR